MKQYIRTALEYLRETVHIKEGNTNYPRHWEIAHFG
jgi:hypothetical protein